MNKGRMFGNLVLQAFFATYALRRLIEARRSGRRLDVLDAAVNAGVVVTGTLVLIRQLREEGVE